MGPRVFWFKADDFGSVLLPEADLLRMVFRCVLDMDRFKMLKSSPFQDVCRPYSQTSHTKCKTFHDPTPTEIGLSKVLSCLGVEQTLWRHHFIQCSLECL